MFKPEPAVEFRLWRESTTIFMTSGPGGCEPYGIAVTLKRHGLIPEIYASRAGPYFLETAKSADKTPRHGGDPGGLPRAGRGARIPPT